MRKNKISWRRKFLSAACVPVAVSLPSAVSAMTRPYQYAVKPGDTLFEIIYRLGLRPIYGKTGKLRDARDLNGHDFAEREDHILPGTQILLQFDEAWAVGHPEWTEQARPEVQAENSQPIVERTIAAEPEPQAPVRYSIHELELGAAYAIRTLSAIDRTVGSRASLYSSSDLNLNLGFRQKWTERFRTFFRFSLEKVSFQPTASLSKVLATESVTLSRFKLGSDFQLTESLRSTLSLQYGSELFLRGLDSNQISVESRPLLSIDLHPELSLYHQGSTELGASAQVAYVLGGNSPLYDIQAGRKWGAGLYLRFQPESRNQFLLDLNYDQRKQNTAAVDLSDEQFSAGFTWIMPVRE